MYKYYYVLKYINYRDGLEDTIEGLAKTDTPLEDLQDISDLKDKILEDFNAKPLEFKLLTRL